MKKLLHLIIAIIYFSAIKAQTCAFNIGNDTTLCTPFNFTIHGPNNFTSYTWSPGGANTQNITVSSPGTYSCTATISSTNFVINGSFSQGNSGFTSNYNVPANPGPWGLLSNPGTYQTTTSPNLVHNNFMSFGDHTTGTGNMMVCNGSAVANAVVWNQTISIVPNSTYNFSAWVASVYNTTNAGSAKLQFSINNVLIGPTFPAPLTGGVWSNFAVNWNSGNNTSAIIKIVDQNFTAPGANDFAIDDISFKITCTHTDVITISPLVNLPVSAIASGSLTCQQNSVSIIGTATLSGAVQTYTWAGPSVINGANTLTATVNQPGIYTLSVSQGACASTTTVAVYQNTIVPNISASVSNSLTCQLLTANLIANSTTAGLTYTWLPQNTNSASVTVSSPGSFSLAVLNPLNGCANSTVVTVTQNTTAPNISATLSNSLNCQMLAANLTGNSTTPGLTYTWLPQNVNTSSISVNSPASYSLVVLNPLNGCTNNTVITVTQNTTAPNISASVSNSLNCLQQTANLIGNSTTAAATYNWLPQNVNASSLTVNSPGSYSLVVFNPLNGCSNNTIITVSQNTAVPNISATVSNSLNCVFTSAALVGNSTTPGLSYFWAPQNINSNSVGASTAGNYTLTITNPVNGCTNSTVVAVNQNTTTPNISATVSNSLNCLIQSANLIGTSTTSGLTYSWSPNVSGSANLPTATANSPGSFSLAVLNPLNGCTNNTVITVTQNTTAPNISATVSNSLNCVFQTASLIGNSTTAGATFSWSPVNATTAMVTVNSPASYSLAVLDPLNGCKSNTVIAVIQNTTVPTANINVSNMITCQQPTAVLTASSNCTNPLFTWLPQNINTTTVSVSTTGVYTLTTVDSNNSCTNSAIASVQSTTNFSANISVLSQINCFGNNNGALQISNATGTAPFTISNLNNNNTVSNILTLPFNLANLSAANYSLLITDANGCSQTLYANINQPPALSSAINGANVLCQGQTTLLNALVNGGNSPYFFHWSHNGGNNSTLNVAPAINTIYTLTVTDNNGCLSVAQIKLTVNPKPTATITNGNLSGCEPVCATFSLLVPPASDYLFNWSFSSSALPNTITSNSVNPDLCFAEPGTYNVNVSIVSPHGCTTSLNYPGLIQVHRKPVADFSFNPHNPSVFEPIVNFTNLSAGASAYQWYNLNQQFSTQVNPDYLFLEPGKFFITLIASNLVCSDTLSRYITIEDELTIYIPNSFSPNNDNINETFYPVISGYNGKNYSFVIFDRWGELIYTSNNFFETQWNGSYKGKLCKQDQYIYKLHITNSGGKSIQRTGHVNLIK